MPSRISAEHDREFPFAEHPRHRIGQQRGVVPDRLRVHDVRSRVTVSAVPGRLDPACPPGCQAVCQPGSEQRFRGALDTQVLRDVSQSGRRLDNRVPGHAPTSCISRGNRGAVLPDRSPRYSSTGQGSLLQAIRTVRRPLRRSEAAAPSSEASKEEKGLMSKYDPLRDFLAARAESTVTLTFSEIDDLVGALPPSARKYEVWWLNNDPSHQHCQSWGEAGYTAHPDLRGGRVTFRYAGKIAQALVPGSTSRRLPVGLEYANSAVTCYFS